MALRSFVALLLLIVIVGSATAAEQRAKLTSLEWPPYSSASLPGGGVSVEAARSVFAAAGWALDVEFLPWKRAVDTARSGGAQGYFPEYFDPTNSEFSLSRPMGVSVLGFAEAVGKRFVWNDLHDLIALGPIGVVDGYANSVEFDEAVSSGRLIVERVSEDLLNLKKLASGRIRAAVIDKRVMDFLITKTPALAAAATSIVFNAKPLTEQKLHIAFRKSPDADLARAAFDRGLTLLGDDVVSKLYLTLEAAKTPLLAQR